MKENRLEDLFKESLKQKFCNSELIVRAGEEARHLYLIEQGFVRQYAVSEEGEELTTAVYAKGSVFFVPWIMGRKESDYYFESMGKTTLKKLRKDEFIKQLGQNTPMAMKLMQRGYMFANSLMLHMQSMIYGNSRQKIASVLLILASWYGREVEGKLVILMRLPHRLLATMVGMTRETTSLAITELRAEEIIGNLGQKIVILNRSKLEEIARMEMEQIRAADKFGGSS